MRHEAFAAWNERTLGKTILFSDHLDWDDVALVAAYRKPGEHRLLVPDADLRLARGCDDPIDRRKQQITADRQALLALGEGAVEDLLQVQALRHRQDGGDGAEVVDHRFRFGVGILQSAEDVLGLAQVLLPDDARLAVYTHGLDSVPVEVAPDLLAHQAGHDALPLGNTLTTVRPHAP